jgi:hypothetical protein
MLCSVYIDERVSQNIEVYLLLLHPNRIWHLTEQLAPLRLCMYFGILGLEFLVHVKIGQGYFASLPSCNSIELSPSWEAAGPSVTKEFHNVLRTPNVYNRVYENLPLVSNLEHMNQSTSARPMILRPILIISS